MCIGTRPRSPRTSRTMSDAVPRGGMKSTIVTTPSAVSKVVSRISVSSRYFRDTLASIEGAIRHLP